MKKDKGLFSLSKIWRDFVLVGRIDNIPSVYSKRLGCVFFDMDSPIGIEDYPKASKLEMEEDINYIKNSIEI